MNLRLDQGDKFLPYRVNIVLPDPGAEGLSLLCSPPEMLLGEKGVEGGHPEVGVAMDESLAFRQLQHDLLEGSEVCHFRVYPYHGDVVVI